MMSWGTRGVGRNGDEICETHGITCRITGKHGFEALYHSVS